MDGASSEFDLALAVGKSYESDFLGLSEQQAVDLAGNLGMELRVLRDADENTAVTLDLKCRRLTVEVRQGTVTNARAG